MPKILHMPKRKEQPQDQERTGPIQRPILPDADEEHASVAVMNKWVALGDAALSGDSPTRKVA
jgi:hypothetical protein